MSGQYLRIRRKAQWIELLEAEQVLGGKDISVEFWLRLPSLPERGLTHVLGTPDIGTPGSFNIGVTDLGKVLVSHGTVDFESRTGIVPGAWTHVAYQYDSGHGTAWILLNGVVDRELRVDVADPVTGVLSLGDGRQRVGFGLSHYDITDLRFWYRFRTDAEIRGGMEWRIWEPIPGLGSLWPLIEDVGLADPIVGLKAATDGGSVVWGGDDGPPAQFGERDELPVFGERSWIQLPGRAERLSTKAYTVEAWVAPEFLDREVYWSPAVSHCGDRMGWELRAGSHRCSMVVTVDHQWVELEWQPPHPSTDWFHVAGVVDQRMVSLLVNGVPVVSRPISGRLTPSKGEPIGIGRNFVWTNRGYRGAIQEVRLWNGARTVAQIQEGRYRRASGTEPDLVAVVPLVNWGIELVDRSTHLLVGGPEFRETTSPPLQEAVEAPRAAPVVEVDPRAEQERLLRQLEESERRVAGLQLELASQAMRFEERLARLQAAQDQPPPAEPGPPEPPVRELEPGETTLDDLIRRTQEQIDAARDALRGSGASYNLRDVSMELRVIPAAGGETVIIPTKSELGRLPGDGLSRLRLDFASDDLAPVIEPTTVVVPDVRDYTEVLARRRLNEVGLTTDVVVQALDSPDHPKNGRVVTQLPEPDDEVTLQSPVTIFIGRVAESEE